MDGALGAVSVVFNVGLGHLELALDFGAELLEALEGTAGPGSGLGQALEIGVCIAHVGWHPGRVNPVKPPRNPNNHSEFQFLGICVVTPRGIKKPPHKVAVNRRMPERVGLLSRAPCPG